jgi:hypothetical protein
MLDGGDGLAVHVDGVQYNAVSQVGVSVHGDWELVGMVMALLEIGRALRERPDVMDARKKWLPDDDDDVMMPTRPGRWARMMEVAK